MQPIVQALGPQFQKSALKLQIFPRSSQPKVRLAIYKFTEATTMRFFRVGFLFATAMSAATSVFGAAGTLTPEVEPLTAPAIYSTNSPPFQMYVAYRINFTNTGRNTINHVRFTFTASATDPAETVTLFDPASYLPPECAQTGVSSFECTNRQLKKGESFFNEPIVVFFRTPVRIINWVADTQGTDFVKVGGKIIYAEGTSGHNPPRNSDVPWSGPDVSLGTADPTHVTSALPRSGGSLFTGDGAITVAADPFAVSATVPQAPTFSVAELLESDVTTDINCTSLGNFHRCFAAAVTIPDITFLPASGSFMTFVLRVDKSKIKYGTKINDVLIQYDDGSSNVQNVGLCASPTTPRADGIPCIAKAVFYKNKSVPGWTTELSGDFEWILLNLRNGLIKVF
jgi:hypothetical protein